MTSTMRSSALLLLALTQASAVAQDGLVEVQELLPEGSAQGEQVGRSVAVDGDRVVIGSSSDDSIASNAGAVYIFVGNNGVWGQEAKLYAPVPHAGDEFGWSVDLDAGILVASAPGDDDEATDAGATYAFSLDQAGWSFEAKITASSAAPQDRFGFVALDDGTLLVGVPNSNLTASNAGAVYAFVRTGTTWPEQAILQPASTSVNRRFGAGVALLGERAIVAESGASRAHLYARVGTSWIQGPSLSPLTGVTEPFPVAIDGDIAVLGDPLWNISRGRLLVFERQGTLWPQTATLFGSSVPSGRFAAALSLRGSTLVVGERGTNRVFAFDRQSPSTWTGDFETPVDALSGDNAGLSVDQAGTVVIAGASGHDHLGTDAGAAYVFSTDPAPLPAFCFGDGGDQAACTPCPCGNDAPQGTPAGCGNSTGLFCRLKVKGIPRVSDDTLQFDVEGANILTFALLASADNRLPIPGGPCPEGSGILGTTPLDGLRCIGANLIRHGTRATDFDGNATNPWGPPAGPPGGLIAQGGFASSQTRQWMIFYREDMSLGCGTGQNTSNGVSVTFVP